MSVAYGGPSGGYAPSGKVNFGWIGEAFELFKANTSVWIVATLLALVPVILSFIVGAMFGASAPTRAMLLLVTRAMSLIGGIKSNSRFFATEAEARAWLDPFRLPEFRRQPSR